MTDLFKTIQSPSQGSYKEKNSKFLAFCYPVSSQEEIRAWLDHLKKHYHDARHHCYAWRLGADMELFRMNDDGEPSGSAGTPILGQIQSRHLSNILVVVVRYFGGTLLGVGGLIRAYRSAASDALDQAVIIEKKVCKKIKLEFAYERMNLVMKLIKDLELSYEDPQFDLSCTLTLNLWIRQEKQVLSKLKIIEGCRITRVE